ncbi:MAG: MoaD family protein [Nitrososphaerales archaeon]
MKEKIEITLRYFASIRDITGKEEEALLLQKDSSVMDALKKISEIYGEKFAQFVFDEGKPRDNLIFLVNGQTVNNKILDERKLEQMDVLVVLPPISGG